MFVEQSDLDSLEFVADQAFVALERLVEKKDRFTAELAKSSYKVLRAAIQFAAGQTSQYYNWDRKTKEAAMLERPILQLFIGDAIADHYYGLIIFHNEDKDGNDKPDESLKKLASQIDDKGVSFQRVHSMTLYLSAKGEQNALMEALKYVREHSPKPTLK